MALPHWQKIEDQDWRNPKPVKEIKFTTTSGGDFTRGRKNKKPSKKIIRKILGVLVPSAIFLVLLCGLTFIGLLAWISKDLPTPDGVINRSVTVSTKIYDRTGQTVLYDIHGNIERTLIPLSDIPDYAKEAVLTAEDRNFYKEQGFSVTGIIRSIIIDVVTGKKYGGSTLTQQFVKNALLTNEKTYTRKIKELLLSYQLEKKFTKDQILNMYFNEIPYGSVIYGIEAASQSYFGKSAKNLTLAESAILAAIPRLPTYYSPYGSHKDKLLERQRYILDSMADLGYITIDQAQAAKQDKIIFRPPSESIIAPHFVMYVKELLSDKYGDDFINQEGLKVYTTLDLDKQKLAEAAVKYGVDLNGKKYQFGNAALVALDPKTGQILAMVGSADYFDEKIDGQVNVALSPRQPGSSFKPFVYTAAFIKGYTPDTIVYDTVTNFNAGGSQDYIPHDYDSKERGQVTFRKALGGSLNIPAVKATYLTGLDNILNLADKLGYATFQDRSRFGLSIVLGGAEVKLLEHAGAYAALAQEGVKHDLAPLLKVEDKNGKVLYEYQDKSEQVIDPEITRLTTDILSDDSNRAYIFGAHGKLTLPDRPVAAKTGTTNDYHDAWAMGYTPSLVCGVWAGNSDNAAMKKGADGSIVAAPIWNKFMSEALKNTPVENFTKPQPIVTGKAVLDGKQDELGKKIIVDAATGVPVDDQTPSTNTREITVPELHDILYYVNKDDPRGPAPEHPENDPQFANWESGVQDWASRNNIIPSSTADILAGYNKQQPAEADPLLNILAPTAGQTITSQTIKVDFQTTANAGIKKIEFYLDDELSGQTAAGSSVDLHVGGLDNGRHTLKIVLTDQADKNLAKAIDFNLNLPAKTAEITNQEPSLTWLEPAAGSLVKTFPVKLSANLANYGQIKKINFYYVKSGGQPQFIGYDQPDSDQVNLLWRLKPAAGDYLIYGNIITQKNTTSKSEILRLKVE